MDSSPLGDLRCVRANDTSREPAVRWGEGGTDLGEYLLHRRAEDLVLVEGATPVWFVVQRLPAAFLLSVLGGIAPEPARQLAAFRAAVHRIEPAQGDVPLVAHRPEGAPRGAPWVCERGDFGAYIAPLAWVQEIADRWGAETVREMGFVALHLAGLPRSAQGPFGYWGG